MIRWYAGSNPPPPDTFVLTWSPTDWGPFFAYVVMQYTVDDDGTDHWTDSRGDEFDQPENWAYLTPPRT